MKLTMSPYMLLGLLRAEDSGVPGADPGACLLKAEALLFGELLSDCAACMLKADSSHLIALMPASSSRYGLSLLHSSQDIAASTLAARLSLCAASKAIFCHQSLHQGGRAMQALT